MTEAEFERGKQLLLKKETDIKSDITRKAKRDMKSQAKIRDDEDEDMDDQAVQDRKREESKNETEDDQNRKHAKEKENYTNKQMKALGPVLKHYINCGFNILIYGTGSKRNFVNHFVQHYLYNEPRMIVNGFHSAATIKSVTNPILNFAMKNHLKYAIKSTTRAG